MIEVQAYSRKCPTILYIFTPSGSVIQVVLRSVAIVKKTGHSARGAVFWTSLPLVINQDADTLRFPRTTTSLASLARRTRPSY
jgi:hypothetical protein